MTDSLQKDRLFRLAEHYIEDTNVSLFLTGKAGTGKTTFLRHITESTTKRFVVLAPTGVAAVNARGTTIHSFFSLPLCPYLPDVPELKTEYQMPEQYRRLKKEKVKIIKTIDLLIIDEVSMVRADLLDAVDMTLRRYRRSGKPFGGVQLLLIGDAQQLSPVVTEKERPFIERVYPSPYFFHSKALQNLPYVTIELQKVYRQSDREFISILNGIRDASVTPEMLRALNSRMHAPAGPDWIRLTTHNIQADNINASRMEALPGAARTFAAQIDGDYPESLYPAAAELSVKPGARMMFIRNDSDGRFYNGKLGTVTSVGAQCIELRTDDGETVCTGPAEWENLQYSLEEASGDIVQEVKGTFRQFPLRPAWAITIHKSQGLTFEHVIIDAGAAFAFGQVYVALSRCRTLEGISLESPIRAELLFSDADVSQFNLSFPEPAAVEGALAGHEAAARLELMCECFSFEALLKNMYALRKLWRDSLAKPYPEQLEMLEAAVAGLSETEGVASKFRAQLRGLQGDSGKTAERIAKACGYFLPRLEELDIKPLLTVEVGNAEVAKRLKNLGAELMPLLQAHIATMRSVASEGFEPSRYRTVRALALLGEDAQKKRQRKTGKVPGEGARGETDAPGKSEESAPKIPSREQSLLLYREGLDISQIAARRELTEATVWGHLTSYLPTGEVDICDLVSGEVLEQVSHYMKEHPDEDSSTPCYNYFNQAVSYNEIRAVRLWLRSPAAKAA